jgi:hypothetical protein
MKFNSFLAINDTIITMIYGYGFLKTWLFENCSLKRNQCRICRRAINAQHITIILRILTFALTKMSRQKFKKGKSCK